MTLRFPLTTSLSRGKETTRRAAKADFVIPSGFRNSSRSIRPGASECGARGRET